MELAFLLRSVGAHVVWITNHKQVETNEVIYSLERRMLDRGVQVHTICVSPSTIVIFTNNIQFIIIIIFIIAVLFFLITIEERYFY